MLIDSHAHLTTPSLEAELEGILSRAEEAHLDAIVNIATHPAELLRGLEISTSYPWIYQVASTTPHDVEKEGEEHFSVFAEAAQKKQLVAIGETGLDYHYAHSDPTIQKHFFQRYLQLAKACDLPVVVHCREAFADFFSIVDEEYAGKPGVLHCFTGTLEEAKGVIDRGWYLSLSGIVTFKKSDALRQVAKWVPLDHLLIETDTPYLAPQSRRGKQNEPAYIVEIAECLATVRGLSFEEIAHATASNTRTLFRI